MLSLYNKMHNDRFIKERKIRAVTQVLENLALRAQISTDTVVLGDFYLLCAIPLRDGCDLLDAIERRMAAQFTGTEAN